MTAEEFWKNVGTRRTEEVCGMAGTTLAYFMQIKNREKRPSSELAEALSKSGETLTGLKMSVECLRQSPIKRPRSRREELRKQRAAAFAAAKETAAIGIAGG